MDFAKNSGTRLVELIPNLPCSYSKIIACENVFHWECEVQWEGVEMKGVMQISDLG